jgi:hypothetical protein
VTTLESLVRFYAELGDIFSDPAAGTRADDGPGSRAEGECLSTETIQILQMNLVHTHNSSCLDCVQH